MKKLFSIIAFVVFTTTLFAGSPVIEGKITDASTGESLTGVKVAVEGSDIQAITDFDGYFIIKGLPEGTKSVKLSYLSYESKEVSINKKEGAFLNLQMESVGAYRAVSIFTAKNE